MQHLKVLNKYFFKYKWRFLLGIIFIATQNVFGIFPAQVVRSAVDLVISNIRIYKLADSMEVDDLIFDMFGQALLIMGFVIIALAVIKGFFMFMMRQTIIVMSRFIEFDLKNEVYAHYQKLGMAFYKRNNTGDLMNRATEDVSRVRMYLGPAILYSVNLIVLFVVALIFMLQVSPKLTFYALLPLPILSLSIYVVNSIINRKSEEIQRFLSRLTSVAQEVYSGIRVVKAFAHEHTFLNFYEEQSEEYRNKSLSLARVEALFFPLMLSLIGISTLITIYVGGQEVMRGAISPGNIAEFVIYINMLTWPVTSLGWVVSMVQRAAASQERINEFLKSEPDIQSGSELVQLRASKIKFDRVSFTYPDTGTKAIKDFSFEIKAGERVAVIGRTGSGKSTLAQLISRRYDVDSGSISIDGQNITSLDLSHFLGQLGYVPQDIFLFSDTIRDNIAFSKDQLTDERILKAADDASIKAEILEFKDGLDTIVGERGVTLSGGQKQRISIARALVGDPDLVILDDCLSAVDAQTERNILDKLGTYLQGRTSIIITHRIFALMDFDKIIVLENGAMAEMGTHEELMAQKGVYRELFEMQQLQDASI